MTTVRPDESDIDDSDVVIAVGRDHRDNPFDMCQRPLEQGRPFGCPLPRDAIELIHARGRETSGHRLLIGGENTDTHVGAFAHARPRRPRGRRREHDHRGLQRQGSKCLTREARGTVVSGPADDDQTRGVMTQHLFEMRLVDSGHPETLPGRPDVATQPDESVALFEETITNQVIDQGRHSQRVEVGKGAS